MDLKQAVQRLADSMTTVATEALEHMTCQEFATFAEVLVAGGHRDAAIAAVIGHAHSDYEDDDEHNDVYRALTTDEAADERALAADHYYRLKRNVRG